MSSFTDSLRRGLASAIATVALSAFSTISAAASPPYDYTDFWWVPIENGWGVNFTQSNDFIFAALFVHDSNNDPTWFTANMTWDGQSQFTGPLYLTHGTYYGRTWNPADNPGPTVVGTATFIPSTGNDYQGTFIYSVNAVGTFTKAVTRFTIKPVLIAGSYVGGQSGTYSNCNSSASNKNYQDFFNAEVTQNGSSVTMTFTYTGGQTPLTCTLAGTTIQNGSILRMPSATYQCSDGLQTTASVSDLRATPLGIEGQFSAASVGGGCRETARFAGTLN
jgi:hypothetical protein